MEHQRDKKQIAKEQDKLQKAKDIFDNFHFFSHGFRTLFLIQRHKEGGETHNSRIKKLITSNPQEWYNAVNELVRDQAESDLPLRIYACVNERDFNKAVRKFKFEQLEADYYADYERENFYLDIKNRFLGCLMQPQQQAEHLFLWDIDDIESASGGIVDTVGVMLQTIPNDLIVKTYRTKNGWHMITKPFNYTTYDYPSNVELKKDGLLLLSY